MKVILKGIVGRVIKEWNFPMNKVAPEQDQSSTNLIQNRSKVVHSSLQQLNLYSERIY